MGKRNGISNKNDKNNKRIKRKEEEDNESNNSNDEDQQQDVSDAELVSQPNNDETPSDDDDDDETNETKTILGKTRKVILIIDEAILEPVKTSKGSYELLNCDDHLGLHRKLKRDPSQSRPDICHQMLLAALDSPLNKAGHLEIFVRTQKNVLIKVAPNLRIPRTFKRFSGLMVQLLHQMKIRASDGNKPLLQVVKNPVTRHLPPNARVFGLSVTGTLVNVHDFVPSLKDEEPVVFVFGGFAHGHVNPEYAEAMISVSEYPLSGACAIGRLFCAFENKWGII